MPQLHATRARGLQVSPDAKSLMHKPLFRAINWRERIARFNRIDWNKVGDRAVVVVCFVGYSFVLWLGTAQHADRAGYQRGVAEIPRTCEPGAYKSVHHADHTDCYFDWAGRYIIRPPKKGKTT